MKREKLNILTQIKERRGERLLRKVYMYCTDDGRVPIKDFLGASGKKIQKKFEFIGFDACLMANLETAIAKTPNVGVYINGEYKGAAKPENNGALKRLNMFLRWVVRDGAVLYGNFPPVQSTR